MKKNNIIAFILITIFISMVVIGFSIRNIDKVEENVGTEEVKKLNYIRSLNLETEYPTSYTEVLILYNDIVQLLYSGKMNNDEIIELLTIQRMLFTDSIQKSNSIENQYENLLVQLEEYNNIDFKVYDSKIYNIDEFDDFDFIVTADVLYFGTNNENIGFKYYLEKEFSKWKIAFFEPFDDF